MNNIHNTMPHISPPFSLVPIYHLTSVALNSFPDAKSQAMMKSVRYNCNIPIHESNPRVIRRVPKPPSSQDHYNSHLD
ncbi:hypothetical protein PM082_006447 [Marasmius tenuissimus]|nr:hypothetical protein PM082_006447 [Marasmius tenuissimus]